jgi:hydrogenase/urease accessory protein HupE
MKRKIFMIASLILATMSPSISLAHSGHLADESVHHLLHAEHLIIIISIGLIAFTIDVIRRK